MDSLIKKKYDKDESLSKSMKSLMIKEAFYGLLLMQMNKEWTDKIDTSGVGKSGINYMLYINEIFWESLSENELWRLMVLKHDALHIAFHHIEVGASLPERDIVALASNIVVNQYIDPKWLPLFDVKYRDFRDLNLELIQLLKEDLRLKRKTKEEVVEEWRKIPPRGVYLQDFFELNMEPLQGLRYYYDKLLKAKGQRPGKGGSEALNDLLEDKEGGLPDGWSHDWREFEGLSEAERSLMRSQIDYMLKEVADQVLKSRGTIPGELAGYIEGLNKKDPPKFDWKRFLRRFAGGSEQVYTKKLHRKFNKRFEENPGLKIKQRRHVLLSVDTSGSVSNEELREFFHEIYHIQKMGSDITVLQFDAAISNVQKYKKGLEDKIAIKGRGGTSFDECVIYANEHSHKFCCHIILTDGEAPAPDITNKLKTLWVHSSKSNINQSLKGLKIKLN